MCLHICHLFGQPILVVTVKTMNVTTQLNKCDECNQKGDVWRGIEKNAETANDCEICWSDFLYKRHWASIMEDSSKDLFTIVELAELADLARFYRAAIGNPHECM